MVIIQGGTGVGISDWRLARSVSCLGQLGVVSGTALDQIRREGHTNPVGINFLEKIQIPHASQALLA